MDQIKLEHSHAHTLMCEREIYCTLGNHYKTIAVNGLLNKIFNIKINFK